MKSAVKKEKGKVDLFGERYRARAHQLSPRLRAVVSYINDNREVVLEHTAMEIATATQTSDATVVRAIQALGFAGLRELKQTMERWFGTSVTSAEKMRSTVTALSSDVNSSIDFVLEGHQRVCEVLSRADNRAAVAQAVALLSDARQVGIFGIGASGILAEYTARLFSRIGLPAYVMNRTGFSLAEQLIGLQRGDVLIMMGQKSPHREGLTTLREAKRLGIPTILLTQAVDSRFSQEAQVVIDVPRGGDSSRMPLHGTVLVCLEMIVLSVASTTPQKTVKSLKRINDLCCMIAALTAAGQAAAETYTVGSGGTYRPFEFENSQKQLEGFDIDIIKAIAKAEGFDVKLVNTPWEGIFATLNTGDRDIIISGITITDKRKQMVDFSAPYFPAEQSIVVAQDSQVDSLAALKNEKVGVVNSSTGDIVVSEVLGKNSTAIKRFDNTPLMLQELFEDGVSAAVGDVGVVKYYIKQHPEKQFKLVPDAKFERQYFGIAVAKGNSELLGKINAGLQKIVADGTYAKIYKTWFDDNVPTLPAQ